MLPWFIRQTSQQYFNKQMEQLNRLMAKKATPDAPLILPPDFKQKGMDGLRVRRTFQTIVPNPRIKKLKRL